ncbi:MAG: hypothetical protein ACJ8FY_11825 [Gemmataceae bacterium]
MTQPIEKTLHNASLAVGIFLVALLVGVGGTVLFQKRNASVDVSPKGWISDEDMKVLKDPEAANKAAYLKMSKDAWQRSRSQQPQPGWDQGWKK